MELQRVRVGIILVTLGITGWLIGRGSAQLAAAALFDERLAAPDEQPIASLASARDVIDACAFFETHPVFDSQLAVRCTDAPISPPRPVQPAQEDPECTSDVRLLATYLRRSDSTRSFAAISDATGHAVFYGEGMPLDGRSVITIRERTVLLAAADGTTCSLAM